MKFTNPKLTRVLQTLFFLTFQPSHKIRLFKLKMLTWHKIPGHYITHRDFNASDNHNCFLKPAFYKYPHLVITQYSEICQKQRRKERKKKKNRACTLCFQSTKMNPPTTRKSWRIVPNGKCKISWNCT